MSYDVTEKPWGFEAVIEKNENYMVKRLVISAGEGTSKHYHQDKHETMIATKGTPTIIVYDDPNRLHIMRVGDVLVIQPGERHRIKNEGDDPAVIIEASTPHPDDVVRVDDPYGR